MGPTYTRHTPVGHDLDTASEIKLILCNMWIKKVIFKDDCLLFNTHVTRNEENILLSQMGNVKMIYDPALFVWHYRKSSIRKLTLAVSSSGYNRAIGFFIAPKSFHFFFLIPAVFNLYLLLLLFFPHQLTAIPLGLYVLCLFLEGTRIMFLEKNGLFFFFSLLVIPIIHITYGISFMAGLLQKLKRNKT